MLIQTIDKTIIDAQSVRHLVFVPEQKSVVGPQFAPIRLASYDQLSFAGLVVTKHSETLQKESTISVRSPNDQCSLFCSMI